MKPLNRRRCPEHGATYTAGCLACADASREDYRKRTWDRIKQGPRKIPAAPIRNHILELLKTGVTQSGIAMESGVSSANISRIVNGAVSVHRDTATAILQVSVLKARQHQSFVAALATARRLQHLAWMGWSQTAVADGTGVRQATLTEIVNESHPYVTQETETAVAGFFRTHWQQRGDSQRARNTALRRGWTSIMEGEVA